MSTAKIIAELVEAGLEKEAEELIELAIAGGTGLKLFDKVQDHMDVIYGLILDLEELIPAKKIQPFNDAKKKLLSFGNALDDLSPMVHMLP